MLSSILSSKKFFYFILGVFLGGSFWLLFFSNFTRLEKMEIQAEDFPFSQKLILEEKISSWKKEKIWKIFPKDNFFFLDKQKFVFYLKDEVHWAKKVEVEKVFPDKLSVKVVGYKPAALWCNDKSNCLILDDEGKSFWSFGFEKEKEMQEQLELSENMPLIFEKSGTEWAVDAQILSKDQVNFFMIFSKKLLGMNAIQKSVWEMPMLAAGWVKIKTVFGWDMFLSFDEYSADFQSLILDDFFKKSLTEEEKKSLEYVDFRVKGRITYKLKESDELKEKDEKQLIISKTMDKKK